MGLLGHYETNAQAKASGFFYSRAEAEADLIERGWARASAYAWTIIGRRGQFEAYPTLTPRFRTMIGHPPRDVRFKIETRLDGLLSDDEVRSLPEAA